MKKIKKLLITFVIFSFIPQVLAKDIPASFAGWILSYELTQIFKSIIFEQIWNISTTAQMGPNHYEVSLFFVIP